MGIRLAGRRRASGGWRCGFNRAPAVAFLLAAAGIGVAGCQPGINWRGYAYEPVLTQSRKDGKLTFVYFRSWASVRSSQFEETVLKSQAVRDATADLNCVALEYSVDAALARSFGLDSEPSFAIVDTNGRVLATASGEISRERVLRAISDAKVLRSSPPSTP